MFFLNKSKKRIQQLEKSLLELSNATLALSKHAMLTDITTTGRVIKFTFVRNGEFYIIETYRTMSDNIPEWKEKLL